MVRSQAFGKDIPLKRYAILIIIILSAFIRLVGLGTVPNGLEQDETSIGYNAYSLIRTGKDEWGISYPVTFKAFGEHKLPGYIYLSVLPVRLLGTTPAAVRLPSAVFGIATILFLHFLVRELLAGEKHAETISLIIPALLSINPWHVHFSRGAFEVVPALFFLTAAVYFLIRGIRLRKPGMFYVAIVAGAAGFYTYNIMRLLVPLLMFTILLLERKNLQFVTIRHLTGLGGLITFLALPFAVMAFSYGGAPSTSGTVLFTSDVVRAQLLEFRSYFVWLPQLPVKILFNTPTLMIFRYLENILRYLSPDFLFLTGSPHGNHGIGTTGQMYLIELPLIIAGLAELVRHRNRATRTLLVWTVLSVLVAAATREAPYATRGFFLTVPFVFFSGYGMHMIIRKVRILPSRIRHISFLVLILGITWNTVYYFGSYVIRFPVRYASAWRSLDRDVALFITTAAGTYDRIIIDRSSGIPYSSLLYHGRFDPAEFQRTVIREPDNAEGFSRVQAYGTVEFVTSRESVKADPGSTLLITSEEQIRETDTVIRTFRYPERPVVLWTDGVLSQYPTRDPGIVAVTY